MPQPFLGSYPSRAFPSRRSRAPLEAACSPAVIHRRPEVHHPRLITADFTDAHAHAQLPGSLEQLWTRFPQTKAYFPLVLGVSSKPLPASQLHLLRSFLPFVNPFAIEPSFPGFDRPLLFWASPL